MMAVNIGYVVTTPPSIAGDVRIKPLTMEFGFPGPVPIDPSDSDIEVELWMRATVAASDVAITSQMLGRRFRV
jgi:hypothetical protein